MITMTLHAVTVECESLTQALCLLSEWARMGRIELPPAPTNQDRAPRTEPKEVPQVFPRVKEPAKPTPRKTSLDAKKCGVCGDTFIPPNVRVVTCSLHRMKPGQNLETERARFLSRERKDAPAEAPTAGGTKPAVDKVAAKGLLGRPPIRPDEPTKACSACGDKARLSTLDKKDRCPDCQPVGGKA
jgi:hypothetical protein